MRQAWAERDASAVIRLVRWNTDLSQTALSRMTGLAQSTISDIISGKIELKHHDRIAQALDGLGGPPTPTGTSSQPAPVAPVNVDSFLPTRDLAAQLHVGHGRRISHTTVERLAQRVHALRLADDVIAGNDLLAPALRELSTATTLLDTSTHTDTVGRELRTAVGELAQITGWIASDAGQHERAERVYRLGLRAAREAQDTTLAAQLAGSLAYQLTNTGAEDRGVELAQAAIEEAGPTAPARARALYWDRLAWAHAKRADIRSAVRALAQASEALSQHDSGRAEPEWLYWVDEGELQIMEARVHTELHRPLRAVPLLEQVLERYDSTHGREMALYLSWLAVAYADANEPEEAARVAARMIAHARGLGSDRTAERERVVRSVLQSFRDVPEVRDVLERA
ncbi:helix-turn-helix domain-containing protein [Nocardiopsis alborubida]|uniref:Helix-turn-helix transcriptional regulator n=1 Tax=Nocardiopsis alborubida TaxID=146802 RepID=A0A7X6M8G4_9ACTN|nr:helix-turn-helix transcriptional regulator [Nocardiopsis alborubida]NKY96618.1 helix-turn-helix transcriptional regulator [Nocardiopsis alborubida]